MAFTHIWHLLHLYGKKIASLALMLLLLAGGAVAQTNEKTIVKKNLPGYDDKIMHYGFFLAGSIARYQVQHSQEYVQLLQTNGLAAVNPKFKPVFNTGFILNLRVVPQYVDLRFLPGVGFYSHEVEYVGVPSPQDGSLEQFSMELGSTMIELPLLVKLKSKRRKNVRMYFIGGVKNSIDVSSKKNERTENQLRAADSDVSLEYGVGIDLFYPFFKFAPELRFSHGMKNMLIADNNIYARMLQRMSTHTVTLYLNFE